MTITAEQVRKLDELYAEYNQGIITYSQYEERKSLILS